MPTHYKDIELSRKQSRILKSFINNSKPCTPTILDTKNEFLFKYHLLSYSDKTHLSYTISDKGLFLLAYKKRDNFRFRFPVIISIIALIISIIALVAALLWVQLSQLDL